MSPECVTSCPTAGCCSTTCRSASATAPRSRWSAPTAPARPRCCGSSPATSCPHAGVVTRTGGLGVMRQMVGTDLGDDPTVADLLLSVSPAAGPRGRGRRRALRARADGDRRREDPDALRRGAGRVRRRRRLRPRGRLGRLHRARRSACPTTGPSTATLSHPQRRRAEAAGAGVPPRAVPTRCCCSTSPTTSSTCPARSGSSSGSASPTRRSCSSATTASCSTTPRPGSSPSSSAFGGGNSVWTHPGGFASYHEARRDRFARFEELRRRWDEEHAKIKALVLRLQDQGGVQRRHGLAVQGRPDPAPQVRGGRAADRAAARAAGDDAAQGRPHRQARGGLRATSS